MCDHCKSDEFLEELEDIISDDTYKFAYETLYDIYTWVEENEHVTPNQRQAVKNIVESKNG